MFDKLGDFAGPHKVFWNAAVQNRYAQGFSHSQSADFADFLRWG